MSQLNLFKTLDGWYYEKNGFKNDLKNEVVASDGKPLCVSSNHYLNLNLNHNQNHNLYQYQLSHIENSIRSQLLGLFSVR